MAMTSISFVGLLILLLVIGLPLLLGSAAIKHKNWAGLALLTLAVCSTLGFLTYVGFAPIRQIQNDFGGMPHLTSLSNHTAVAIPAIPVASTPVWFVSAFGLLFVLGMAFAIVRRKNWVGLTALGVTLGLFLFAGLFIVRSELKVQQIHATHAQQQAMHVAMQTAPVIGTPPTPPVAMAEVASDEELAAVASAQPKIELDSEIVIAGKVDDVKSDRPDWIDAHRGDNQKLITSGPFTTKDSCESDTQKQLVDWLWSRHEELWPRGAGKFPGFGTDVTQAIKSQHEELRDTSVGEMHILYTLAEVTPEVEAQIAKSLANAAAQVAQKRGVRTITFAGAGVLSLVALTHIVLKSGGRKTKNGAP
jgi:hypothetical protein